MVQQGEVSKHLTEFRVGEMLNHFQKQTPQILKTFDQIRASMMFGPKGAEETSILTKAPSFGAMEKVLVSQVSNGLGPFNHPEGLSPGGGQPPSVVAMAKVPYSQSHAKIVNEQGLGQIGTSETYNGGQPPSVSDMRKVVASQTLDSVNRYNHLKSLSHGHVSRRGLLHQNGASDTYGGGQPPSINDMARFVVSKPSDSVDPYNHPKVLSLSDVNKRGSSQNCISNQDAPSAQEMVGMSLVGPNTRRLYSNAYHKAKDGENN